MNAGRTRRAVAVLVAIGLEAAACGKKGPPLPPLVRIPAAPELTASRRGDAVDLQITVPSANTDGTRPANVERVDVFEFTGASTMTNAELLKHGTKVASLAVKAPRDPDDTIEPDEPADNLDPLSGQGLDQGAVTHVEDMLTPSEPPQSVSDGPLLGSVAGASLRTYVGVGIAKHGRPGRFSTRVSVPVAPAPVPPSQVSIAYDEKAIAVSWPSAVAPAADSTDGVLPAHPLLGQGTAFNVYDDTTHALLTKQPVTESRYEDPRIEWGAERCYMVRAVRVVGGVSIESDSGPSACQTLVDTFPPAAPKGLTIVAAGMGTMSLIWTANAESDLAGYIVLRAVAGQPLMPITPMPIAESIFNDMVQPGGRYAYAVKAIDKAGNQSEASMPVEETAR